MAFPDSHLPLILTAPYPTYYVALRLKGGRMLARVRVNGVSFHPEGYSHPLCSDTEVWRYQDWRHWSHVPGLPSVHFPLHVEHELFEGCCHRYETLGGKLRGPEIHKAYALPASPPVPIDAQFMDTYSQRVPMWQTVQGHLLVEAHLNGRRAGWMILDTGASGFVIEPAVADQFKLPRFGNLRIAGVAGKVKTQFRRASQLRIGPLSLSDPVMMEMKIGRLVRHFHDRVIGIAGFDVFRRCRITLPCTLTRRAILKAHSYNGKVMPTVQGNNDHAHLAALWPGGSSSSSNSSSSDAAAVKNLQTVQQVQQHVAQVNHAADAASSACPAAAGGASAAAADNSSSRRRGSSSAKAAVASVEATSSSSSSSSATATPEPPGRRRRRESSSSVGSSSRRKTRSAAATAAAAAAAPAAADAEHTAAASGSRQQQLQQQPQSPQQQQPLRQMERVEVPPLLAQERLLARPADNYLVELLVQRPLLIRGPSELEDGYVWQELIMIASLPHVSLEFVAPRTGLRHESLFLVDTGAGGTEVMFHSRAAKELQLLVPPEELPGWAEPVLPGQQTERYVSGVGSDGETGAKAQGGVAVQTGKLPELVIRGQAGGDPGAQGSLLLREVKALFSTSGGLDISLYSAGMICVDLLSRMQVVLDYPNKRIGWKVPVPAPVTAAAAAAAGTTSSS